MYATLIETTPGVRLRSSFFQKRDEAIAYANRMPGVVAVEKIGGNVIWTRTLANLES